MRHSLSAHNMGGARVGGGKAREAAAPCAVALGPQRDKTVKSALR